MHLKRLLIAIIFLPLFYLYINYLPSIYFFVLIFCVGIIALYEFYLMYRLPVVLSISGVLSGGILLYTAHFLPAYFKDALFIAVFALLLLRLLVIRTPIGAIKDAGTLALGLLYIPCLLSFMFPLIAHGKEYILLLFTSVWLSDILAFYIGSSIGKHKLYTSVSPNKTIEGAISSLIGGLLGAIIIKSLFPFMAITGINIAFIGIILGASAIAGDLLESMFKRDAGVKDSSNLIPGHGGMLDKLDSIIIAGPVLYYLLYLLRVI
ncbi:MAG TPA: hypothetical protein DEP99_00895 [Nitrospiraceae bacterium]|nr:hypothetical protein [Nitrospiraceae bacterium]